MMQKHVVFLNRFYWPDVAATGQQLTDLAEDLVTEGWDVTVIASQSQYALDRPALARSEVRQGVRIVRVRSTRFGRGRIAGRIADYVSYMIGAAMQLFRVPRPDVIVACSDPPLIAAIGLLGARLRGARLVYNARDVYPQLAARLGVLPERSLRYRAIAAASRFVHQRCDLVVTLGPRMADTLIAAGAPRSNTLVIPDGADSLAVRPVPPEENRFVHENKLADRFVVLYSGNAGRAHVFDAVLDAAAALTADPDIVFLFVGGGSQYRAIERAARVRLLHNCRFLPYQPRERLHLSLSAAHVSLVTEHPGVVGLLLPSKTFGILASGRPLIFVGSPESDVAAIVREAGCGFIVDPEDGEALAKHIRQLRKSSRKAAQLGTRARQAAETRYDRRSVSARWHATLTRCVRARANVAANDAGVRPRRNTRRTPRQTGPAGLSTATDSI